MTKAVLRCENCSERKVLTNEDLEVLKRLGFNLSCGVCRGALVVDETTENDHKVLNGALRVFESAVKGTVNTIFPSPKSTPKVCVCPKCGKWHKESTYQYR